MHVITIEAYMVSEALYRVSTASSCRPGRSDSVICPLICSVSSGRDIASDGRPSKTEYGKYQ